MNRKDKEFRTDTLSPPLYFDVTKKTSNRLTKGGSTENIKYYSYNYPTK